MKFSKFLLSFYDVTVYKSTTLQYLEIDFQTFYHDVQCLYDLDKIQHFFSFFSFFFQRKLHMSIQDWAPHSTLCSKCVFGP